ncbi:hypothetical protein [Limnobacter parvus]|uniref:DUF3592 domain-containing protein n=1 Tax=Limnobacter parvus TaxID=2939690 RepID=A0ABT1XFX6_9BURK|nr:hypothetical protein [Limnobacter parvus]MCR2745202.1 hypothetical protein [Limnobacter parvus]
MTITAFIAGLAVVVLLGRYALQSGLLLNRGATFITHNLRFSKHASGELRLKARGGLLTDRFSVSLQPNEIDLLAFAVGHRPKNNKLDKAGYKVYRLVCVQPRNDSDALRTAIGDFTLTPSAQVKFERFTSKITE